MLNGKFYFVDDDDITLFLYKRLAKKLELDAVFCENGAVLLDALKDVSIGTIVLDVNMPVLNGLEVVRELDKTNRLQNFNVLVMMGSKHGDDIKYKLEEFGIANFKDKPLKEETLRLFLEQGVN